VRSLNESSTALQHSVPQCATVRGTRGTGALNNHGSPERSSQALRATRCAQSPWRLEDIAHILSVHHHYACVCGGYWLALDPRCVFKASGVRPCPLLQRREHVPLLKWEEEEKKKTSNRTNKVSTVCASNPICLYRSPAGEDVTCIHVWRPVSDCATSKSTPINTAMISALIVSKLCAVHTHNELSGCCVRAQGKNNCVVKS
jgi:hypothetical protein